MHRPGIMLFLAKIPGPDRKAIFEPHTLGRWPANVITDGSEEVLEAFAQFGEKISPMPYIRQGGSASEVGRNLLVATPVEMVE